MRVALAVSPVDERRLSDTAEHHGHVVVAACSGGDELALRLAQQAVDLAIVSSTPAQLTASLIESADLLGVRMLVVAPDADARRHARRLGIVDLVDGAPAWELLDGSAARGVPPADPAEHETVPAEVQRRPGRVVAVWGPHGAPGRTSVAIALAAELAASGMRVVLVDADTHAASVAPALGLLDEAPGFAAACRLAGIGGLDAAQFERIAAVGGRAATPIRVLTGIGRAARWPELGEDRVAGVLAAARQHFEVIVVDVAASLEQEDGLGEPAAPQRNAAGLTALRAADSVIALASADPVGIARHLRARSELAELVDADRVVTVVTKVRSSVLGLDPGSQVRQTLARFGGIEDAVLIPWDPAAFDAALLGGRPLGEAAPRSPARAAVREVARRLVPAAVPTAARRRRGRRIA